MMVKHPIAVPGVLSAGANEHFALTLPATGVQIYECRGNPDGKFAWAFVAPEATLFDLQGKRVGKHYAGPTWELDDGSKVVGSLKQRSDAPIAGAIPWLLIGTKSTGGAGALSPMTSLQRVNTDAGVAPSEICAAGLVGRNARVAYTADYYFFSTR